jgi:hypothetical protein
MRFETEISVAEFGQLEKPTHGNSRQLTATAFLAPVYLSRKKRNDEKTALKEN